MIIVYKKTSVNHIIGSGILLKYFKPSLVANDAEIGKKRKRDRQIVLYNFAKIIFHQNWIL